MTTATQKLLLPAAAHSSLVSLAKDNYPFEGCGVLIGCWTDGGAVVLEVTHAENLNRERAHDRYELNPLDLLKAEERANEIDAEVLGIWHTHPDHPAVPSKTDREAAWEGWSYVIVSVLEGRVDSIRSWRLEVDAFTEEGIER